jgi:cytochrome bd-type quinol oxidase subunit 1
MSLALFIADLKTLHLVRRDEQYAAAARFWTRIFAVSFAMGVRSFPVVWPLGSVPADAVL